MMRPVTVLTGIGGVELVPLWRRVARAVRV